MMITLGKIPLLFTRAVNTMSCKMLKHNLGCIIFLITVLSLTEANFDFKLGYCRFKCVNQCNEEKETDNPLGDAKIPSGYYWRDFHGKIPTDAYPLGESTQYPQTYVGLVFEPSKVGTFPVTIVDGLDYVYVVQNGTVIKKTKHIQILCTMEPERFSWVELTPSNAATLDPNTYAKVYGSYENTCYHFIVKYSTCKIYYAGFKSEEALDKPMEYALLDGTPKKVDNGLWLIYKKTQEEKIEEKNKAKSFFSHHYEYNIRPDSIIPSFYKQFNIGDCSITCTNEGTGSKAQLESETQTLAAMAYYWTPRSILNKDDAVMGGYDFIGESYCSALNWYEVGASASGRSVYIVGENSVYSEDTTMQIMCSNHPEMLEWVNTTSETFNQLDRSLLIPGGELDNGTETFIGRFGTRAGSVRVFDKQAVFYSLVGESLNFEVLMFKDPKNEKNT